MGDWTGTLPSLLAGDIPSATEWAEVLGELTAIQKPRTAWVPTLTNLTLGNGLVTAKYRRVGHEVTWRFSFLLGSTSAVGTAPRFTLPAAPHADYISSRDPLANAVQLRDANASNYDGEVLLNSGSTVEIFSYSSIGIVQTVTAIFPFTWVATDAIACSGCYETA